MTSTDFWRDLSMIRRVKAGAFVARAERLHDSLDALPRRGAPDEGVHGDPLLELKRGAVASTVDVHGARLAAPTYCISRRPSLWRLGLRHGDGSSLATSGVSGRAI